MLASLIKRFSAPADTSPLPEDDARLALCALMVRAARSDDVFLDAERTAIIAVLRTRFDLSHARAAALLTEAEAAERAAPDTVRFTRMIKQAIPIEDRVGVVEALWRVALADEDRDPDEDAFIRQVVSLIGVADRDSALARRRVVDSKSDQS